MHADNPAHRPCPRRSQVAVRDVIEWDVKTWCRPLPLWEGYLPVERPARALALGERGGGLSLWLAAQGLDVVCSDVVRIRPSAHELHRRYGVDGHIQYQQQDATALSFEDDSLDVVAFKSVLGALATRERQEQAMREIHRVLKGGGCLLFAENLSATRLHQWLRHGFVRWSHNWRYLDCHQDRELFGPFSRTDARTTGFLSLLGRTEAQRTFLARLDTLFQRIVPHTWHTVWYGAAIK
jgi:SAM-dependent methyltransferase